MNIWKSQMAATLSKIVATFFSKCHYVNLHIIIRFESSWCLFVCSQACWNHLCYPKSSPVYYYFSFSHFRHNPQDDGHYVYGYIYIRPHITNAHPAPYWEQRTKAPVSLTTPCTKLHGCYPFSRHQQMTMIHSPQWSVVLWLFHTTWASNTH